MNQCPGCARGLPLRWDIASYPEKPVHVEDGAIVPCAADRSPKREDLPEPPRGISYMTPDEFLQSKPAAPAAVEEERKITCPHGTVGYCETCALVDPGEESLKIVPTGAVEEVEAEWNSVTPALSWRCIAYAMHDKALDLAHQLDGAQKDARFSQALRIESNRCFLERAEAAERERDEALKRIDKWRLRWERLSDRFDTLTLDYEAAEAELKERRMRELGEKT